MESIDPTFLAIILSVVAPVVTMVIAKFKLQTASFKQKFTTFKSLVDELDNSLQDDKITVEESKRIILLVKKLIKD